MKDGFFFLGILILIFVVWVASGGPSRPISFAGPYLNPITQTGTSASAYGDPSAYSSVNTTIGIGPGGVSTSGTGVASFSRNTSGLVGTDPDWRYFFVYASQSQKAPVSTAGWKIVSAGTGRTVAFPQGAEIPRSGAVNPMVPITLSPGDEVIIGLGDSPVGISFRENECTGYLEEHQDFHPSLSLTCPTPSTELARFYPDASDSCVAYVRSIPYCGTDTSSSAQASGSCRNFVDDHLNYNACVAAHQKDPDFKSHTWRVFLGSTGFARSGHDTLTLLDASGKAIDSVSY
jgi:hypothetical protein